MIARTQAVIRPAQEADRASLANLIHFETHVHRHLDWRLPLDWLGSQPYLLAERGRVLQAALACPIDPPEVPWVRLFATAASLDPGQEWEVLWPAARSRLAALGYNEAAAIPLQQWFRELWEHSQFTLTHAVVMLAWSRGAERPAAKPVAYTIREMMAADLPAVTELDTAAFVPVWRNSLASLQVAYQQAAVATVAEGPAGLVGYQISTVSPMGGHLARLAVLPGLQGGGVGYALVDHLLTQFERRGAVRVTVNTQHNNTASLHIYQKSGFIRTGEEYPVYQLSF
jgi:ribosomal protein S18 acetylase RimI-like enzyme